MTVQTLPRLYRDLAAWWPLFSPPQHYIEEAEHISSLLADAGMTGGTMLELGSGGGSLAYHMKRTYVMTLTDLSPDMLAVSRAVNPECVHQAGDMRTISLGREFDVVLIHDAIMYLLDEGALREALENAARHVRPGGGLLVAPDFVRETFEPATDTGGEDAPDGRGLRFLEWSWDPDPGDSTAEVAFAIVFREATGRVTVELDRHRFGLFPRATWESLFHDAGLSVTVSRDPWKRDLFLARKPAR